MIVTLFLNIRLFFQFYLSIFYKTFFKLSFGLSQPTLRREGDERAHGCVFHGRKMHGVATNVYSRKTSEKPENVGSTNFKCKRFTSCFYARGRYQHLTRPSQGTTVFNQVCKYDFKMFYFPFFMSFCVFVLFMFIVFFIFLWSTRVFPSLLHILNCDEEIRPTQFFQN